MRVYAFCPRCRKSYEISIKAMDAALEMIRENERLIKPPTDNEPPPADTSLVTSHCKRCAFHHVLDRVTVMQ